MEAMTQSQVTDLLASIPVGTIIAWITVLIAIITAVGVLFIKLYKLFEKTHQVKDENEMLKDMVREHDEQLKMISEQLTEIQNTLDTRDKLKVTEMRHTIIRAGEDAINKGCITIRELRSLEELFEEYSKSGNGYATTLMTKVRNLRVIGKLDENDNDVEE